MALLKKLKTLAVKAFVGGEWNVAFRKCDKDDKYQIVDMPEGTCIADPFMYEADGEHYLFVELFEKKKNKACIAYYKFIDGKPVYQGKIIDQMYHMSYPCVFEHNGVHYMIPETSANLSIDLYQATEFPHKWQKVKTLFSGVRYIDTTVLKQADRYYAVSYQKAIQGWLLDSFVLDMETMTMIKVASKQYDTNICRPAGRFLKNDQLLRPAQNCAKKYGENLILYCVDRFDDTHYEEHEAMRMDASSIPMDRKPDRIHTYNRDSLYEVVDVYYERIDLLHGVNTLWRAYLRKYFTKA